jgi:hypothetical protein
MTLPPESLSCPDCKTPIEWTPWGWDPTDPKAGLFRSARCFCGNLRIVETRRVLRHRGGCSDREG